MTEPATDLAARERSRQLLLTASTAAVFAFVISYVFAILDINDVLRTGLVSDIRAYDAIADSILGGSIPYMDFPFEHLPIGVVPIAIVGLASEVTGVSMWLLWPLFMTPLFVLTALWVDRLDDRDPPGFRFVVVSAPLLPLVLFRLEPWIEILAVAGLLAFVVGHVARGVVLTVAATLGKGWPIALALMPWKMGKRAAAISTVAVSLVTLAVVASLEGFQAGREFEGIHTETLVGSLTILFRHITGATLGTGPSAGALYVDVPPIAVVVNALPGLALIAVGLVGALRLPLRSTQSAIGITILGILLASPLSSTQFIWWVAPFVAMLALPLRRTYIVAGVCAFASIAIYEPDSVLWAVEVVARNIALITLAVLWAIGLVRSMTATSRSEPL